MINIRVFLRIFVVGTLLLAHSGFAGDRIVPVRQMDAADSLIYLPEASVRIDDNVTVMAVLSGERLFLGIEAATPELSSTLENWGVTVWFEKPDKLEYGVEIRSGRPLPMQFAGRTAQSRVLSVLPRALQDSIAALSTGSGFKAQLTSQKRRLRSNLIVPGFDARFDSAAKVLWVAIPLRGAIFPDGRLQLDGRHMTRISVDIGSAYFSRLSRLPATWSRGGSQGRWAGQRGGMGMPPADGAPTLEHHRFQATIAFNKGYRSELNSDSESRKPFSLRKYLETLARWATEEGGAAQGFSGGRRSRGRQGAPGAVFPISAQALVISDELLESSMAYYGRILELDDAATTRVLREFASEWDTDNHLPVLLTMGTSLHESYLDLNRWTVYLQDKRKNLYEAARVERRTIAARPESAAQGKEKRLSRRAASGTTAHYLMLFPFERYDGASLADRSNQPVRLVVVSNDHPDQKLELPWEPFRNLRK